MTRSCHPSFRTRVLQLLGIVAVPCLVCTGVLAAEGQFGGLIELRAGVSDTTASYANGGFGKFRHDNGSHLALSQAALVYTGPVAGNLAVHVATNGALAETDGTFGLTEAWLQYRSLPSAGGLRIEARAGLQYPRVSLENLQTAWSSPYTLDYSAINSWIAEEVRHKGVEISVTRLGKFAGSAHDYTLGLALFQGNDPTGAMLAWHGWVISNRQSLQHESLPLPDLQPGFVPASSDVFRELDHRIGMHASFEWEWHARGRLLMGYYDNNADPSVVKDNQWAWLTTFRHLGIKWQLTEDLELLAQYLRGSTLMVSPRSGKALVDNDYDSAYAMLSTARGPHRWSARIESFAVTDLDGMPGDPNEESGEALTLAYHYRITRNWFTQLEYTRIQSTRPARASAANAAASSTETQLQIALKYLF